MASEGSPTVGWVRTGEWLNYTATVQADGAYTLKARVASPNAGRTAVLSVDGVQKGTIAVPNTGGWTRFATVNLPVTLTAGTHVLKLTFQGDGQNINCDRVRAGHGHDPHDDGPPSGRRRSRPHPSRPRRGPR